MNLKINPDCFIDTLVLRSGRRIIVGQTLKGLGTSEITCNSISGTFTVHGTDEIKAFEEVVPFHAVESVRIRKRS